MLYIQSTNTKKIYVTVSIQRLREITFVEKRRQYIRTRPKHHMLMCVVQEPSVPKRDRDGKSILSYPILSYPFANCDPCEKAAGKFVQE